MKRNGIKGYEKFHNKNQIHNILIIKLIIILLYQPLFFSALPLLGSDKHLEFKKNPRGIVLWSLPFHFILKVPMFVVNISRSQYCITHDLAKLDPLQDSYDICIFFKEIVMLLS